MRDIDSVELRASLQRQIKTVRTIKEHLEQANREIKATEKLLQEFNLIRDYSQDPEDETSLGYFRKTVWIGEPNPPSPGVRAASESLVWDRQGKRKARLFYQFSARMETGKVPQWQEIESTPLLEASHTTRLNMWPHLSAFVDAYRLEQIKELREPTTLQMLREVGELPEPGWGIQHQPLLEGMGDGKVADICGGNEFPYVYGDWIFDGKTLDFTGEPYSKEDPYWIQLSSFDDDMDWYQHIYSKSWCTDRVADDFNSIMVHVNRIADGNRRMKEYYKSIRQSSTNQAPSSSECRE
jgi:hypothetical protein